MDNTIKLTLVSTIITILLAFLFAITDAFGGNGDHMLINLFVLFFLFLLSFSIFYYFSERIYLQGNILFIRRFLHFVRYPSDQDGFVIFNYNYHLLPSTCINIYKITNIVIRTTSPFIPVRISIGQINYRDRVYIYYTNENNKIIYEVFNLLSQPKIKQVIMDILKIRPEIRIDFTKNSFTQTLWENGVLGIPKNSLKPINDNVNEKGVIENSMSLPQTTQI